MSNHPIHSRTRPAAAVLLLACLLAACQAGPVPTPTPSDGAGAPPATRTAVVTTAASTDTPTDAATNVVASPTLPPTGTAPDLPTSSPSSATPANGAGQTPTSTSAPAGSTPTALLPSTPTAAPTINGTAAPAETPAGGAGGEQGTLLVNSLGDEADARLDAVCAAGPEGVCTLRAAIQEANASHTLNAIAFAEGLSGTLHLASALPVITAGVAIRGPGPAALTVDAGRNGYRVLTFDSPGDNQPFDLAGLTLTNGQSTLGGGLYLGAGDLLNVTNSALAGNEAAEGAGGGVYNAGGTLSLSSVQISANSASTAGGGIYNLAGSLTLVSAIIVNNEAAAGEGGGVRFSGSTLVITASTLRENSASANGGGLWSSGMATLTSVTLEGNAGVNGGGAYNRGGVLNLQSSTVAGNHGANGAGVFNFGGTLYLTNATLSGNAADQSGGGLYNVDTVSLNNVTVALNTAGQAGGGLVNQGGTLSLKNSLVALQAAGGDCAGSLSSLGYNLDGDQSCGLTGPGDQPGQDPRLDPLAYYGGATATHRLQAASPAIDAGNDSGCPTVGQRGLPRPQDGPDEDTAAACDIGAVEYTPGVDP